MATDNEHNTEDSATDNEHESDAYKSHNDENTDNDDADTGTTNIPYWSVALLFCSMCRYLRHAAANFGLEGPRTLVEAPGHQAPARPAERSEPEYITISVNTNIIK